VVCFVSNLEVYIKRFLVWVAYQTAVYVYGADTEASRKEAEVCSNRRWQQARHPTKGWGQSRGCPCRTRSSTSQGLIAVWKSHQYFSRIRHDGRVKI